MSIKYLGLALAILCLCSPDTSSAERFGAGHKSSSISLLWGVSSLTGSTSALGTKAFLNAQGADSLYTDLNGIGIEYAEHVGKVSLGTGITYWTASATPALRTALQIPAETEITLSYFDIPITYRLKARETGSSAWNLFGGLSLIMMVDIINASEAIFDDGSSEDDSDLSDKHIDFGIGLGAEFGVERKISQASYLTVRIGIRDPFTGTPRATSAYLHLGVTWLAI